MVKNIIFLIFLVSFIKSKNTCTITDCLKCKNEDTDHCYECESWGLIGSVYDYKYNGIRECVKYNESYCKAGMVMRIKLLDDDFSFLAKICLANGIYIYIYIYMHRKNYGGVG